MSDVFSKTWSDTFRSVLVHRKSKNLKKIVITVQKKDHFPDKV